MHISSSYLPLFHPLWCKHVAMCQNSNQMCAPEATQRSGNFFASLICCNSMQYCYSSVQSHFICKQMMIIQTEVYFWEISKCTCMKCCLLTHGGVKQASIQDFWVFFRILGSFNPRNTLLRSITHIIFVPYLTLSKHASK